VPITSIRNAPLVEIKGAGIRIASISFGYAVGVSSTGLAFAEYSNINPNIEPRNCPAKLANKISAYFL